MANYIIPYPGNKSKQANEIVKYFGAYKYTYYIEVFMGGLGLFLNKPKDKIEIINDLNDELVNLYNVIRDDKEEFKKQFNFFLSSKSFFDDIKYRDLSKMNKFEKAFRTFYIRYHSYLGVGRSFASHTHNHLSFEKMISRIEFAHERLRGVNIENRDYKVIIEKYNTNDTLFYLDPPYFGTENRGYAIGARNIDIEEFISILKSIKGRFLLSHIKYDKFDDLFYSAVVGKRDNTGYMNKSNYDSMVKTEYKELIYSNKQLVRYNSLF